MHDVVHAADDDDVGSCLAFIVGLVRLSSILLYCTTDAVIVCIVDLGKLV